MLYYVENRLYQRIENNTPLVDIGFNRTQFVINGTLGRRVDVVSREKYLVIEVHDIHRAGNYFKSGSDPTIKLKIITS